MFCVILFCFIFCPFFFSLFFLVAYPLIYADSTGIVSMPLVSASLPRANPRSLPHHGLQWEVHKRRDIRSMVGYSLEETPRCCPVPSVVVSDASSHSTYVQDTTYYDHLKIYIWNIHCWSSRTSAGKKRQDSREGTFLCTDTGGCQSTACHCGRRHSVSTNTNMPFFYPLRRSHAKLERPTSCSLHIHVIRKYSYTIQASLLLLQPALAGNAYIVTSYFYACSYNVSRVTTTKRGRSKGEVGREGAGAFAGVTLPTVKDTASLELTAVIARVVLAWPLQSLLQQSERPEFHQIVVYVSQSSHPRYHDAAAATIKTRPYPRQPLTPLFMMTVQNPRRSRGAQYLWQHYEVVAVICSRVG